MEVIDLTQDEDNVAPCSLSTLVTWWKTQVRLPMNKWLLYDTAQGERGLVMMTRRGVCVSGYGVEAMCDSFKRGWLCSCGASNHGLDNTCGRCGMSHPERRQVVPSTTSTLVDPQMAWPANVIRCPSLRLASGAFIRIRRQLAKEREGGVHLFW